MTQQYVLFVLVSKTGRYQCLTASLTYRISGLLISRQQILNQLVSLLEGFSLQDTLTIPADTVRMHLHNRLILLTAPNYIVHIHGQWFLQQLTI
jgi:hypothetical protein